MFAPFICCTLSTPSYAMTVDDAVLMAYENNAGIKAERELYQAEKSAKFEAVSEFLPRINAQHTHRHTEYKDASIEALNTTPNTRNYGATISQPLFNGGASLIRMQSASHTVLAAYFKLQSAAHALAAEAVEAYEKMRAMREIYQLNCDNQEVFEKHLEYAKIRFDAGVVTITDVLQAEVRLQDARAQKERAYANLMNAAASFERIVGAPPQSDLGAVNIENFVMPLDAEEFTFAVMQGNPSLKAKELESRIAANNMKREAAQLLPSVSAIAQFDRLHDAAKIRPEANSNTYALQVSIPIFQGGSEYASIRRKRHMAKSSELSQTETERKMREYSLSIWNNYNTALAVVKARHSGTVAAGRALEGVKEEVTFGTRTTLDLLNAQREVFEAKVAHRNAQMEMVIVRFKILQAMGRVDAIDAVLEG